MNTSVLLQQILNGLAVGSIYAIFALGYTLVFSILRIINFSHSAVFTVGAYLVYALTGGSFGPNGALANANSPVNMPFPLAVLVGAIIAGVIGVAIERLAFRPLRIKGADPLLSLVSSLGVAIAIVNLIRYLVGAENYAYQNPFSGLPLALRFGQPPIIIRTVPVIIFIVAIVLVGLLTYLINGTKIGKALQAVSEDGVTARLLGINPDRLILLTFFLSSALGAIAGALVGVNVSIAGPSFGINFGLKGLSVIILGGLGDIPGAVVGGFALGIAEALVPPQFNPYKDAIAFGFLFLVLLVRPQGLLGRAAIQKV
jgi:branched-chain amino acid transport system permease protein